MATVGFSFELEPSGVLKLWSGDSNVVLTCTVANSTTLNYRELYSHMSHRDGESMFFTKT